MLDSRLACDALRVAFDPTSERKNNIAYPLILFTIDETYFFSNAYARLSIFCSASGDANICMPMGKPSCDAPHGTDIPGNPAMLHEIVNTSARYIFSGSSRFSPSLNAGVGVVGVQMTSTFSNAASKSFLMRVRTCSAFL